MLPERSCRIVALVAVCTSAHTRMANADEPTDQVIVRGTASSTASGFVSKASEADSSREVTDVASLLEPLPGVHVRRLGADDTFSTLSIRGSTSSEVAISFAGVPLTGAADPSLDLASLPLWPGAQVKVFRSFAPASAGTGSLGGTLVLSPPKPSDPEGTLAWVGVGSFGEERLRLADVRSIDDGKARIVTALSASRATDDFTYYDAAQSTAGKPIYATRQNAGYAGINGFASVALPLDLGGGEPGTITTTALVQSRLQHLPGTATNPTIFAELATNRELLSFDAAKSVGGTSVVHLVGWTRRDEAHTTDQPAPFESGFADTTLRTDDVTVGAGGSASVRRTLGSRGAIETRLDGSFERFAPGADVSELGVEPGATRASWGAGADFDYRLLPRWALSMTGRVDANVDAADPLPVGSTSMPPAQGTDLRPTGHVGTEVTVGPIAFAAHGGALARPPSFVERYGGGGILPSPTLTSESALTVDAGARYVAKTSRVRAQVELDGFATRADDLITLVPEGALGLLKAENIASARIYGVEASVDARGYGVEVRAGYTGLVTFDDDATVCPACMTRPPLPGRPANDFVGDIAYRVGPVRLRYGLDAVTGLYADKVGQVLVPNRVLQSAGLRFFVPWVRSLVLALDANNLFDVRTGLSPGFGGPTLQPIGDQFDYPLPGRTLLFTARWSPDQLLRAPP